MQLRNLRKSTHLPKSKTSVSLAENIAIVKDKQRAAVRLESLLTRINNKG